MWNLDKTITSHTNCKYSFEILVTNNVMEVNIITTTLIVVYIEKILEENQLAKSVSQNEKEKKNWSKNTANSHVENERIWKEMLILTS